MSVSAPSRTVAESGPIRIAEVALERPVPSLPAPDADAPHRRALILVRLAASHFLWKMVRRVVGTLVKVGSGELDVAGFERLLAGEALKKPSGLPAEWTAPPSGLFLERVLYPGDPPLPPLAPAVPVPAE